MISNQIVIGILMCRMSQDQGVPKYRVSQNPQGVPKSRATPSSGRMQAQYTHGILKQRVYSSLGCPKTQGIARPRASTCLGCTQAQGIPKLSVYPSPGCPQAPRTFPRAQGIPKLRAYSSPVCPQAPVFWMLMDQCTKRGKGRPI